MVDKYKKPDEVMVREVADELVLVNTTTEKYFSLDATGRRMYELLIAGESADDVVDQIVDTMEGTSPDVVRGHLDDLIQRLCAAALLAAA